MQEGEALSAVSFSRNIHAQWRVEEAGGGTKNGKVVAVVRVVERIAE